MKGHIFISDDKVQEATIHQSGQQPKEFCADRIHKLVHHWDSCLNACSGRYNIETKKHSLVLILYLIAQCKDGSFKIACSGLSHCCNTFTHER
jgi:hypothetical protein